MNSRPLDSSFYIKSGSKVDAYQKAKKLCRCTSFSGLSDVVVVRKADIVCRTKQSALDDIENGVKLIEI